MLPDSRVRACAGSLRDGGARGAAGAEARDDDERVSRASQLARGVAALHHQPLRRDSCARRKGVSYRKSFTLFLSSPFI